VGSPRSGDYTYFEFVPRFVAPYEHLASMTLSVPVPVKGVDHMLWLG